MIPIYSYPHGLRKCCLKKYFRNVISINIFLEQNCMKMANAFKTQPIHETDHGTYRISSAFQSNSIHAGIKMVAVGGRFFFSAFDGSMNMNTKNF